MDEWAREVKRLARERDAVVPGDRVPLQAWLDMEYGPIEEAA